MRPFSTSIVTGFAAIAITGGGIAKAQPNLQPPSPPQAQPAQPFPQPQQPFPQAPFPQQQPGAPQRGPGASPNDPPGQYVGQWQCQFASRGWSDRSNTWMYTFTMMLGADGSLQAQGTYYAEIIGYNEPFQARGQWQTVPGGITGNAQAQLPNRATPLLIALKNAGGGNLSYNFQNQIGQMAIACRR